MMENFQQDITQWRTWGAIVLLALLLAWESIQPFYAFFTGKLKERLRHGLRNVFVGAVNALVTGLVFAVLWLGTAYWAESNHFGLLNRMTTPDWIRLIVAILLLDIWLYWWHRMNHRIPFLWRFHRTHHSDPHMDVTTANRFHLGEIAMSALLRIPIIALLGLHIWEVTLYELAMFAVVQFHHANIGLPGWLDRALRMVIVSPYMHKVHHSRWQPETDSNYSSLFSFWDRIFRSFRLSRDFRSIRIGLDEYSAPEDQTLKGIILTPLNKKKRE